VQAGPPAARDVREESLDAAAIVDRPSPRWACGFTPVPLSSTVSSTAAGQTVP